MRGLLHPEVLEGAGTGGGGEAAGRRAQQLLVDATVPRAHAHVYGLKCGQHVVAAAGVLRQEVLVDQTFLDDGAEHGAQAPGVGTWADLKVDVGHRGGLAAPGVDDDHRPGGVARDLAQRRPGPREAVGLPRVLAEEKNHLGMLGVAAGVAAVELGVDPHLAGLFLRQGVGGVVRPESGLQGASVDAAEVVALPTAPIEEDRVTAMLVLDRA